MTDKDYKLIAMSIWRSGAASEQLDKNRVRREAKHAMRELIAIDLAASLAHENPEFDRNKFLADCGVGYTVDAQHFYKTGEMRPLKLK